MAYEESARGGGGGISSGAYRHQHRGKRASHTMFVSSYIAYARIVSISLYHMLAHRALSRKTYALARKRKSGVTSGIGSHQASASSASAAT